MSPLRRFWLAWGGGWVLPVVVGWLIILAGMTVGALSIGSNGESPPIAERPFAFLLLLPLPLGLRLRQLLAIDSLALAQRHAAWVMRGFCLAILPLATLATAMPLALTGIAPLWALAVAAGLVAVGSWLGFACLVSIPAFTVAFVMISVLRLVDARSGRIGDLVAVAALVLVVIGVRMAWRRLEARAVPAFPGWPRSPRLERLSAWFDACVMSAPTPVPARARLPTLATAAGLGLSGLGGSWVLRLAGFVVTGLGAFILSSQASDIHEDIHDRLTALLVITTMMAMVPTSGWLSTGRAEGPLSLGQTQRMVRGLLATERLRPLSRRRSAAATLLAMIGNSLSCLLPVIGGMLLGLVLADAYQGRDSAGLWLLLPQTVAVIACSAAIMVMVLDIHPAFIICGGIVVGLVLVGAPILALHAGTAASYPSASAVSVLLALFLVPLAWWRLAEAELP